MTNAMIYMVLRTNVRRAVLTFLLFVSATQVFALKELNQTEYKNFVLREQLWVCSSVSFPVDISYHAFKVDFGAMVSGGYGRFIQVKPGEHTDGSSLPATDATIQDNASGILNPTGKPAGVYEYIFVSAKDGFCGMNAGKQAVVRVYVVPQVTGYPVLTNVCPGATAKVDFTQFVPAEIKYFADQMGWSFTYKDSEGKAVAMPVDANLQTVGNHVYTYTIDDSKGSFAGKYTEMQSGPYSCPENEAVLNHTVRIRSGADFVIPDKEVNFCVSNLLASTQPDNIFHTNLYSYLGTSVEGGQWKVIVPNMAGQINLPDAAFIPDLTKSENVTIPVGVISAMVPYKLVFEYRYKDCDGKELVTKLNFNITNDFTELIKDERTKDVCRNLVSGVIDLASTFGFSLPLTSGVWFEKDGNDFKEMLYGAANISEMKSGSLYTFKYAVSGAVDDDLCLVKGKESLFNIRVQDVEIPSAEVQMCRSLFISGLTVNLFDYVPGLNDITRVDPSQVIWFDPDGNTVANGIATLKATAAQQTDTQVKIELPYQYSMTTECGQFTGNLYISAIDSILYANQHKTIRICYQDSYATHVDLHQVLGLAGLQGVFANVPNVNLGANFDQSKGVLNAHNAFNPENKPIDQLPASAEYTFEYTPASGEDLCLKDKNQKLKVTVIVTKNVEDHNFFN